MSIVTLFAHSPLKTNNLRSSYCLYNTVACLHEKAKTWEVCCYIYSLQLTKTFSFYVMNKRTLQADKLNWRQVIKEVYAFQLTFTCSTTGFVWTHTTYSVKVLDCNNNFSNINSNFVFRKLLSLVQMGEKFSAIHVIYEVNKLKQISEY